MPHRNQLLQLVAESGRVQRIEDQLPAHRRQCLGVRGHLGMGHDRRSYWTVLLADHQFAIPHDLVEHPSLHLDDTEVRTALRILHLICWICCYAGAHRESNIACSRRMLCIITDICA